MLAAIRRSCSTVVSAVSVQWFDQNTDYSGSKGLLIEKISMSCSETIFSKESGLIFTDESRSRHVVLFVCFYKVSDKFRFDNTGSQSCL